jgi:hypothetical protein
MSGIEDYEYDFEERIIILLTVGIAANPICCHVFRGAAKPGHVRYDFSGSSLVGRVLGSGKIADRAGPQVGQMVLARGLRSAGFRDPDDLYLLYIRENVAGIGQASCD